MAKYQITKKSQSCILKRYAALRFLLYAVIPLLSTNYPLERLTHVLLCLDCDDYDIKEQDLEFINTAEEYCIQKEMDLVWFCKDIERVYIGRKVANSAKKDEATRFKARKLINNVSKDNLIANTYSKNKSNIVKVLRKYLDEK